MIPMEAAEATRLSAVDVAGPGVHTSATATCATGTLAAVRPARHLVRARARVRVRVWRVRDRVRVTIFGRSLRAAAGANC